ncbi:hypothetical protein EWM64_g9153 [Hericium alpestre]|uniref:glucan 1,3-beta-glucosidase n=1 Tax=Hericium alpestre TaxID=135208 RepID=A0A4Y9ZMX2_9AGAM|nr:hypothetical protein EWM64_g9153 [Hericium alpestre]
MSRQNIPAGDVPYDPVPNPAEYGSDISYDNREMPPSPNLENFDLDGPAARPRFMGSAGNPMTRDSFASYGTTPVSENGSSVYALNPQSLSARGSPQPQDERYRDDPRGTPGDDEEPGVSMSPLGGPRYLSEKRSTYAPPAAKSRRNILLLVAGAALIVIAVAVVVPIYFAVIKPHSNNADSKGGAAQGSGASSDSPTATDTPQSTNNRAVITGGDGSTVTMDDGTTFKYQNSYGGIWYHDPADPFNNNAQAQSWSPPLNQTFRFGVDKIRGVNIGGWLTTEPFISPALFEKYTNLATPAIDEWTLSLAMAADTAGGGLGQLEKHYDTFITEQDFAEIAAAGLNFLRIPLPYWAIETWDGEPFLAKTAWKYFLKAIGWARKYGLRINLDFHAVPGSQNGWNHSGRMGTINLLNGPMGMANAQRSLDYIRIIAEFISQPEYRDVVVMFGVVNEPQAPVIGQENMSRFYLQAYNLVREASGTGAGNGPFISYHDGFLGLDKWVGFLGNPDRIALDYHPYLCFYTQSKDTMAQQVKAPCNWGATVNGSLAAFGLTAAGEFSNAVTDCGLYVNGVGLGTRYEGTYTPGDWPRIGSCTPWTDWQNWDQAMKDDIKQFALSSMDALQNWFFWTWKIGNSSASGKVEAPQWSYKLGLENGWMPKDPREAVGACGNTAPFTGQLTAAQTGGKGAGVLDPAQTAHVRGEVSKPWQRLGEPIRHEGRKGEAAPPACAAGGNAAAKRNAIPEPHITTPPSL